MIDIRPVEREGIVPTDLFREQLQLLAEPQPPQAGAASNPAQLELEEDNMFSVEFANGACMCEIDPPPRVAVIGAGPSGLCALRHRGLRHLWRKPEKLEAKCAV